MIIEEPPRPPTSTDRSTIDCCQKMIEEAQLLEGLSVTHLKLLGLWQAINTYLVTGRRSGGLLAITAYSILYCLPYVIFQFVSFFYISFDLQKMTFVFLNCLPCIQVILKVTVFWIRFGEQCQIFSLLRQDFLTSIPQHKIPQVREIYRKRARRCNIYCFMAFLGLIPVIVIWIASPGVNAVDTNGNPSKKILGGWYPFAFSSSPWYEIVFCYEMILMTTHGLLIAYFVCVMLQPLLCLSAHFDVLGYHVATLKVTDVVYSELSDSTQYLNQQLREVLFDYDKLLRYTSIIQRVLNFLVTVILGTGIFVLVIGILQFQFENWNLLFVVHSLSYIYYEATEVFLICLSSSTLQTTSGDLRLALYSSDWYLADRDFAKTAQLMMVRSGKPLNLTAIKMYPISLDIVVGLFQFTYSTAMFLSRTSKEPKD